MEKICWANTENFEDAEFVHIITEKYDGGELFDEIVQRTTDVGCFDEVEAVLTMYNTRLDLRGRIAVYRIQESDIPIIFIPCFNINFIVLMYYLKEIMKNMIPT